MATIHLDAAGSNTAPYDTWAKAATSMATAVAALAAGDDLVAGNTYTETTTTQLSWAFPGTATSPNRVLSGVKAATSGLASLATGAVFTSSGGGATVTGSVYFYGITFKSTSVSTINPQWCTQSGNCQVFEFCSFDYGSANSAGTALFFGTSSGFVNTRCEHISSTFKLGHTGQTINLAGDVRIDGGTWAAGGSTPVSAFNPCQSTGRPSRVSMYGYNFSNLGTGVNVFGNVPGGVVIDCVGLVMPSGWTGAWVHNSATGTGGEITVARSDFSGIPVAVYRLDSAGSVQHELTIVKASGATDGTHPHSFKIASESDCSIANPLRTPTRAIWNDTAGSNVTLTVEIENDGVTLTDRDVALCARFANSTTTARVGRLSSGADALTAGTALTTSAASWTTTGQTTPVKQKLALTIAPLEAGPIEWWLEVFKPSATLYADAMVTLS